MADHSLHKTNSILPAKLILLFAFLAMFGCVKDIPENIPEGFRWEPNLAFPVGEIEFGLKVPFGFDTTLLQIDDQTGFPFWSELDTIEMSGSVFIDFQQILGSSNNINSVMLRMNAFNGFPTEIKVQGYMIDFGGSIIDSLFNPPLVMDRGKLQGGGETSVPSQTQVDVMFDSTRVDNLLNTKKITFTGQLPRVVFFPEYKFSISMGAIVGLSYQL